MALKKGDVANFDTLKKVFADENAALLECTDHDGNYVAVICAVTRDGEDYVLTPFAKMFAGNPYKEINPPEITDEESFSNIQSGGT